MPFAIPSQSRAASAEAAPRLGCCVRETTMRGVPRTVQRCRHAAERRNLVCDGQAGDPSVGPSPLASAPAFDSQVAAVVLDGRASGVGQADARLSYWTAERSAPTQLAAEELTDGPSRLRRRRRLVGQSRRSPLHLSSDKTVAGTQHDGPGEVAGKTAKVVSCNPFV